MRYFIIKEISSGCITQFEVKDLCYDLRVARRKAKEWKDSKIIIAQEIK